MTSTRIAPEAMHNSPYFAQGIIVDSGRTLYIGGQHGADGQDMIVGDIATQAAVAAHNVQAIVEGAGGTVADIVRLNLAIVDGEDLDEAYRAAMTVLGGCTPTVTVIKVAGLARPDALVEVDGVAVINASTSVL
jgi:enamine deaminase RidA (YjgF/YER057c/UK114 family)